MNFKSIEEIKAAGFTGFKTMEELFINSSDLPSEKGVYLEIRDLILFPIFEVPVTKMNKR